MRCLGKWETAGGPQNYTLPITKRDADEFGGSRETHPAVAIAIHAIADGNKSPQTIWEVPTPAEYDHVTMAAQEYAVNGDFDAETAGRYPWGMETVIVSDLA